MLKYFSYLLIIILSILTIESQAVTYSSTALYCANSIAGGHTSINRLWQSPPNVPAIVSAGNIFIDDSFKELTALYNNDETTYKSFETAVQGNT